MSFKILFPLFTNTKYKYSLFSKNKQENINIKLYENYRIF